MNLWNGFVLFLIVFAAVLGTVIFWCITKKAPVEEAPATLRSQRSGPYRDPTPTIIEKPFEIPKYGGYEADCPKCGGSWQAVIPKSDGAGLLNVKCGNCESEWKARPLDS